MSLEKTIENLGGKDAAIIAATDALSQINEKLLNYAAKGWLEQEIYMEKYIALAQFQLAYMNLLQSLKEL